MFLLLKEKFLQGSDFSTILFIFITFSFSEVIAVFKIVGTATLHKLFEQFTATILN